MKETEKERKKGRGEREKKITLGLRNFFPLY